MAVYAIGDLHLSLGCDKPMDIFAGWNDYVKRIEENWRRQVNPEDTVALVGDISWGMTLEMALNDFQFIESLPGKKVLIKGNHDHWWNSKTKMMTFFESNGLSSLTILHNDCVYAESLALCGTRGWLLEEQSGNDAKLSLREEGRMRASLESAKASGLKPVALVHYPPIFADSVSGGMLDIMKEYGVKRCYYGHLHGAACSQAFEGNCMGIDFTLVSADHLKFSLKKIDQS